MSAAQPSRDALGEALNLHQSGQLQAALEIYEDLLGNDARNSEVLHLSGLLLHQAGESASGLERIEAAIAIVPDNTVYLYNRGVVLQESGREAEALEAYRICLSIDPGNVSAWVNLGNLLSDHGHFGEALDCHRNAAKLQPGEVEHLIRWARDLRLIGDIDGALCLLGEVLNAEPENEGAWSAMLFTSQYQSGVGRSELLRRHARWASRFEVPEPVPARADDGTPLRVGFLSPDLGNHPVGIFIAPLLERLRSRKKITTVCFNDRRGRDEYLIRNQAAAGEWREVGGFGDEELERELRAASLDVLIDLCGHGENNRLRVLARKPAPIQMTWAGYTGTTGLPAIDYLISDSYHTPDKSEGDFAETLLCFPCDYIGWEPPVYAPEPAAPPLLANGHPTFGCFNNPTKLTSPTLALWGHLLMLVPKARLVLKYKGMDDPAVVTRVRGLLSVHGISPDRIEFRGQSNHLDHLSAFADIDVALDPLHYSGGISTCEAVWMGVPVVTLPGDTFASRHSFSHLSNAGLGDTIAKDKRHYLKIAAGLVANGESLAKRRAAMRQKISASPLVDLDSHASDFVNALKAVTGRKL